MAASGDAFTCRANNTIRSALGVGTGGVRRATGGGGGGQIVIPLFCTVYHQCLVFQCGKIYNAHETGSIN